MTIRSDLKDQMHRLASFSLTPQLQSQTSPEPRLLEDICNSYILRLKQLNSKGLLAQKETRFNCNVAQKLLSLDATDYKTGNDQKGRVFESRLFPT